MHPDQHAAYTATAEEIAAAATADDACAIVQRFTGDRELLRASIGRDLAATTDPDISTRQTSMRLAALRHLDRIGRGWSGR
jgi:hypothetical protein